MTFEEIFNQKDYGKLIGSMIEKEMDELFRQNIDGINDYLNNRLNVDLRNFTDEDLVQDNDNQSSSLNIQNKDDTAASWEKLREIFYRRNIIVHNDGKINKEYILKTKNGTENEYLISDRLYVKKSILVFMKYGQFIFDKMISKE